MDIFIEYLLAKIFALKSTHAVTYYSCGNEGCVKCKWILRLCSVNTFFYAQ